MKITHALFIVDNSDGEGDRYWVFAYKKDGEFYVYDTNMKVIEYVGDEIVKEVDLTK